MRLIATTALVLVLGVTGALAADAPDLIVDDEAIEVATDWNGLYIGAGVTGGTAPSVPENFFQGDLIIGGNVQSDMFLFGAEAWLGGFVSNLAQDIDVGAAARAGFLVTPEALVYGSLGVQHFIIGGATYAQFGGGVEFLVSDGLSIDLEGKYWSSLNGGPDVYSGSASLNWHFD
jgi:outer membrane immunogenic protein